ncbi:hypothetical protein [Bacillus cereus]|uniref:hypothetical protein n=1 Tax=Bacillus cereus TaxID=1396 RepID=UPI000BEC66B2|nr:hypothetical protein [Bacillus cereus]PDY82782.1 hypothetical protein CON06_10285 [Bacillus cereus]
MEGVVSFLSPEEVFNYELETIDEKERELYEYRFKWEYRFPFDRTSPNYMDFEIFYHGKGYLKDEKGSDRFSFKVPDTIKTGIWTEILIVADNVYESFTNNSGSVTVITIGYEKIMEKLNRNFEEGVLNQTQFENSVRILKEFRLKEIL